MYPGILNSWSRLGYNEQLQCEVFLDPLAQRKWPLSKAAKTIQNLIAIVGVLDNGKVRNMQNCPPQGLVVLNFGQRAVCWNFQDLNIRLSTNKLKPQGQIRGPVPVDFPRHTLWEQVTGRLLCEDCVEYSGTSPFRSQPITALVPSSKTLPPNHSKTLLPTYFWHTVTPQDSS